MIWTTKAAAVVTAAAALALWLGNTSVFHTGGSPGLIAHRGVHQIARLEGRSADSCRAADVADMTHSFIENTLPSMRAAFDAGADVVELDVHLTRDGVLAVFHDWTLDCQTDGTGVTRQQVWPYLQTLDLGHGISGDGRTYPLRGTGVGAMPSLPEVLDAGLPGPVLVNFKSHDAEEGRLLTDLLTAAGRDGVWGVYGGGPPTRAAQARLPGLRGFDKPGLTQCLLRYAALGWSGYVPDACRSGMIAVPMDFAPFLWGWPYRFTARMRAAGTEVILWGPWDGSGFSSGIDDIETLGRVPDGFDGWIWTNRIEAIGPAVREGRAGQARRSPSQ